MPRDCEQIFQVLLRCVAVLAHDGLGAAQQLNVDRVFAQHHL